MNSFSEQSAVSGARLGEAEMPAADCDDFFIARMIVRLHPKRDFRARRLQVAHQSRLLGSRPENQDIVTALEDLRNRYEEFRILLDMA